MTRKDNEIIAVARALQLLNVFSFEKSSYTLTELSECLGFYKSTVHRLVKTLEKWGYLRKDGNLITLGPQVFILGEIYYHSLDLVHLSKPILEDIAGESGETAAVYVRDGLNRLCLCRAQSPQHIRDSVEPGQRLPIYTGASGKLLLAFCQDPSVLRSLESMSLTPLTSKTITDIDTLKEELEKMVKKVIEKPEIGKPLRYSYRNCRSVRIGKFRIIYKLERDKIIFITFEHRGRVYNKER